MPGQYVSVILEGAEPEKRVVIPQVAVQENQAGPFVLIVDGKGRVEARPIKTGEKNRGRRGGARWPTEGETLVVEGIQKVRPGAEVQTAYRTAAEQPEIIEPQPAEQTEFEDQILDEPQTEPESDPQGEP